MSATTDPRLYDGDIGRLVQADQAADYVTLLPNDRDWAPDASLRIMWGQDLIADLRDGRYRAVVCGVNDQDNSHGVIAQVVSLIESSQWNGSSVTSYAKMFQQSVSVHAANDREPYVLKFDLDRLLVFALLRPSGRDHFTLADLERGFGTVERMLRGRHERQPVATVSFIGAKANRLVGADGEEPTFERVLRTMYEAGFRGDVYPSTRMWSAGSEGVFARFPFPAGLDRMREGSS